MPKRILLEVCVATVDDALAAVEFGADRLEINSALALDGLTPSLGAFTEIRRRVTVPLIAMIRPHAGDFCYSESDFEAMLLDADLMLAAGADGLAFGLLTAAGDVDRERNRRLRAICGDRQAVFHRAFDKAPTPFSALEELIDLGFTRVLTSGQEATAHAGILLLRQLILQSAGRIEILPVAGINRLTVAEVVAGTGCDQVHGSMRKQHTERTDPDEVAAVRGLLDELGGV